MRRSHQTTDTLLPSAVVAAAAISWAVVRPDAPAAVVQAVVEHAGLPERAELLSAIPPWCYGLGLGIGFLLAHLSPTPDAVVMSTPDESVLRSRRELALKVIPLLMSTHPRQSLTHGQPPPSRSSD